MENPKLFCQTHVHSLKIDGRNSDVEAHKLASMAEAQCSDRLVRAPIPLRSSSALAPRLRFHQFCRSQSFLGMREALGIILGYHSCLLLSAEIPPNLSVGSPGIDPPIAKRVEQ